MLDPRVSDLARRAIQVQFDDRRPGLQRDLEVIQNDLSVRGVGRSGILVTRVLEQCERGISGTPH
jgi:hypothetical protein